MTNQTQQRNDSVYGLAASPQFAQDQTLFSARHSGLYRSKDGGETWQFVLAALGLDRPIAISCVALAPNFSETPHLFAAGPGGVLRSRDGGETWYVTMLTTPPPFITGLAVSPNYAADGLVFASTMEDGFFRSSNRGVDWSPWNFGLLDLHVLNLAVSPDFAADKQIFLGTESGIFRSINGGLGWQEVDFPIEYAPVLSFTFSPNFGADGTLWAGTESAGLFCSKDVAQTWERVLPVAQVGAVNAVLCPSPAQVLAVGSETLWVSRDAGKSWLPWQADLKFDDQLLCLAAPRGIETGAPLWAGLASGEILQV